MYQKNDEAFMGCKNDVHVDSLIMEQHHVSEMGRIFGPFANVSKRPNRHLDYLTLACEKTIIDSDNYMTRK